MTIFNFKQLRKVKRCSKVLIIKIVSFSLCSFHPHREKRSDLWARFTAWCFKEPNNSPQKNQLGLKKFRDDCQTGNYTILKYVVVAVLCVCLNERLRSLEIIEMDCDGFATNLSHSHTSNQPLYFRQATTQASLLFSQRVKVHYLCLPV